MAELSEQKNLCESSFKLVIPQEYINLLRQSTLPSVCCWLFLQLWGPTEKGGKITSANSKTEFIAQFQCSEVILFQQARQNT